MAKKTRNARIINKIITTPGAIATIPPSDDHTDGTWLETDIYEGEYLFNTYDKKVFSRMGGVIVDVTFAIVANFAISNYTPQIVNEQSTGNVITFTGTSFKDNMTVTIPDAGGLLFSNVSLTYINTTSLQVNFDVAGDISSDVGFEIYLNKEGYEEVFNMNADTELIITGDNTSGLVGRKTSETFTLYTNDPNTTISNVASNNGNVLIVSNDPATDGSGYLSVTLNPNGASGDEPFSLQLTGDGGEISNWYAMATEPALAISSTSADSSGVSYNTASTEISVYLSKAVDGISNATSDNPNITINQQYHWSGNEIKIDFNTTAASYGETFNITVTCDEETTATYEIAVEPLLAITSITNDIFLPNDTLAMYHRAENFNYNVNLNKTTSNNISPFNFTTNCNFVACGNTGGPTSSISIVVAAFNGEAIDSPTIKYKDGVNETVEFPISIVPYSTGADEIGTLIASNRIGNGTYPLTGWDVDTNPYLYVELDKTATPDRVYFYHSDADRTTGPAVAIFYVEYGINNVIEQNSSGYGGKVFINAMTSMNTGDQCIIAGCKKQLMTVGETINSSPQWYQFKPEFITGWNKLTYPELWIHFDNSGGNFEFYGTKAARDARTAGLLLATCNINGDITEANSSGFGGRCGRDNSGNDLFAGQADGAKFWIKVGPWNNTVTNEVGTSGTEFVKLTDFVSRPDEGGSGGVGWNRDAIPTLYFYVTDTTTNSESNGVEIYDNATSRDNRTGGDILGEITPVGFTAYNASGFNSLIFGYEGSWNNFYSNSLNNGDKFYTTSSLGVGTP